MNRSEIAVCSALNPQFDDSRSLTHAAYQVHARCSVFEARYNHSQIASVLLAMYQELNDVETLAWAASRPKMLVALLYPLEQRMRRIEQLRATVLTVAAFCDIARTHKPEILN